MRKSLESLLPAKLLQSSSPTSFASCWKQEPLTLEDAHDKLITILLELVVSWEVSSNSLSAL